MIKAAGGDSDEIEIFKNKDFSVMHRYEKEYYGGFSGLVFGEILGQAQIQYRSYYTVKALSAAAANTNMYTEFKHNCYYSKLKSRTDRFSIDTYQYGKEIKGFTTSEQCSRRPNHIYLEPSR